MIIIASAYGLGPNDALPTRLLLVGNAQSPTTPRRYLLYLCVSSKIESNLNLVNTSSSTKGMLSVVLIPLLVALVGASHGGEQLDYDNQKEWGGVCQTGNKQSPIDIPVVCAI